MKKIQIQGGPNCIMYYDRNELMQNPDTLEHDYKWPDNEHTFRLLC
jgi:hypothetical protein